MFLSFLLCCIGQANDDVWNICAAFEVAEDGGGADGRTSVTFESPCEGSFFRFYVVDTHTEGKWAGAAELIFTE